MTELEQLRALFDAAEIKKNEEYENNLNEAAQEYYAGYENDVKEFHSSDKYFQNRVSLTKEVLCECMQDLYMNSLVIDEPEKYSINLRSQMKSECLKLMENANTMSDLYAMFENSSEFIKNALVLAETICDSKDPDEFKEEDIVVLTPEDIKIIEDFEKIEGVKDYGDAIQDRVVSVFDKERKDGEERKEQIQNMVNTIAAKADSEKLSESIEAGINFFGNEPTTLFSTIFMNKSKLMINESAGDLEDIQDLILAETICTYTLLECIHSIGFHEFTDEERLEMKQKFFVGK